MKRIFSDGTSAFLYTPEELVERLCALIPPAMSNQVSYHGIFAGNSAWRKEIVPRRPSPSPAEKKERRARRLARVASKSPDAPDWAWLLRRVFQVDAFACPHCNKPKRLRCIVVHPPASTRILRTLGAARAPPTATR